MTAILLTIGDELLIGQTVNTNAAWIGAQLNAVGVAVRRAVTVSDAPGEIRNAVRQALADADVVICTGGLGPTHDDLTRQAIADELGRPLVFREDVFEALRQQYAARGRPMAERNRVQAEVPEGFDVLPNPIGTAPGLWFEEEAGGERRALAVLPGVPREMQLLMRAEVLPRVVDLGGEVDVAQKTLLTAGRGEADLADQLGDLDYLARPVRHAGQLHDDVDGGVDLVAEHVDRQLQACVAVSLHAHGHLAQPCRRPAGRVAVHDLDREQPQQHQWREHAIAPLRPAHMPRRRASLFHHPLADERRPL